MVKPLNKEWALFGHKYRAVGAKGEKVDCKACQKQVTAAVNRLQSHMRICPARSTLAMSLGNTNDNSDAELSEAIPTTSELIEQAIVAGSLATERVTATNADTAERNAPPVKKQRQSTAKKRDRPRWGGDDVWINPIMEGPATASSPTTALSFNKRRLEIEETRLQLEIRRDEREERRERLNLKILEAQARKEILLAEKEKYEVKVALALSRKELRDHGVSEDEIDRVLPISNSQEIAGENASSVTSEVAAVTTIITESCENDANDAVEDDERDFETISSHK